MQHKKIKIGKHCIEAVSLTLSTKNLIVLKGRKGYVMCGYLNLKAADKFHDTAVKVTGVSTIEEALRTSANAVSRHAKSLGLYKNQPIKDVLKIIA